MTVVGNDTDFFKGDFSNRWKIGDENGWAKELIDEYGDGHDLYLLAPFTEDISIDFEFRREMVSRCLVRRWGHEGTEEKASKIIEWFAKLPHEFEEPMTAQLRNDLFFGFGYMLNEQLIWKCFERSFKRWGEGLWVTEDLHYKLKEDSGGSAAHELMKNWNWYNKLKKLIEEMDESYGKFRKYFEIGLGAFAEGTGLKEVIWANEVANCRYYTTMNTSIPKINKSVMKHLKDDLAAKIKGRRYGYYDGPNEDQRANKRKAAQLLRDLASLYGVKTESLDRLRKA